MGILIDIDEARKEYSNLMDLTMSDTTLLHTLYGVLDNAPTVQAIPKADYENRLKADMVAMLTDIQLDIEELKTDYDKNLTSEHGIYYAYEKSSKIVQNYINALKENI